MSAAENHEVVGIGDDVRVPEPTLPGFPPVLQKAIPIQVGEQRADDPTLWSTALVVSSSRDPLLPVQLTPVSLQVVVLGF